MKNTYFNQKPARALLVATPDVDHANLYTITSCNFKNIDGLKGVLRQVCKEADVHQKTLLYHVARLYPGEVDIVRSFSFVAINFNAKELMIRNPKTDIDNVPHDIQYLLEDNSGVVSIVKYDQANSYAVLNMYGERLQVYNSEREALKLLGRL